MNRKTLNLLQQLSEQNLLNIEALKKEGTKVIGFYCLYSPKELAVAAGAISVPLCGTRNEPISAAEEVLPRNLCPLIKSSFGFAATDTCPFFRLADLIVGDTTCDGKKKMFELLARYRPMHVMQLPQTQDKTSARPFWYAEVEKLKAAIETVTGVEITDDRLLSAIRQMNTLRSVKKALMDLAKKNPPPLSGTLLLHVLFKTGFLYDREQVIDLMNDIVGEDGRKMSGPAGENAASAPRILMTGVPVGIGSEKVVRLIEEEGAHVVCFENCSAYKQAFTIDEEKPPLQAIAEQYLETPCSVMSPNTGRFSLVDELIREFSVDGVVDLTWQACHTYNIEACLMERHIAGQHGLPYLHLETDYSESDTEQLRVRIEAFIEMLK
jgi:benzoyl-CoA reductase/2-hydroxyglutaryl-CoA dehydratase subunit BcrC/BadD/HgdB